MKFLFCFRTLQPEPCQWSQVSAKRSILILAGRQEEEVVAVVYWAFSDLATEEEGLPRSKHQRLIWVQYLSPPSMTSRKMYFNTLCKSNLSLNYCRCIWVPLVRNKSKVTTIFTRLMIWWWNMKCWIWRMNKWMTLFHSLWMNFEVVANWLLYNQRLSHGWRNFFRGTPTDI